MGRNRQIGGLIEGQFGQGLVEVGLRGGRHAVAVLTEEDLVHVEFEDAFLVERVLDPRGEDDLLDLALGASVRRQKEVLHHLLRDGRRTAQTPALCRIDRRLDDPDRIVARVQIEILVLGGNERLLDQRRDLLCRGEKTPFAGEFVHQSTFARIDAADRGRRVLG